VKSHWELLPGVHSDGINEQKQSQCWPAGFSEGYTPKTHSWESQENCYWDLLPYWSGEITAKGKIQELLLPLRKNSRSASLRHLINCKSSLLLSTLQCQKHYRLI